MSVLSLPRLGTQKDKAQAASCHGGAQADTTGLPLVALIGSPNVGKSALFNALTGAYVTVSNYPGTTVEVTRGKGTFGAIKAGVVDTPGMYQLLPITEEERVARSILLSERLAAVVHIVDAKNLERMLSMTLQLVEAGLPVCLDLNLMDEAERVGVQVDAGALHARLGIPVVQTSLVRGTGVDEVRGTVADTIRQGSSRSGQAESPLVRYPEPVQDAIEEIAGGLGGSYALTKRAIALLVVQADADVLEMVRAREGAAAECMFARAAALRAELTEPIAYIIARARHAAAREIAAAVLHHGNALPHAAQGHGAERRDFAARLGEATMNPWTGVPILFLVLWLLYQFVGVLGAQVLVNFLEVQVFGAYVNPLVDALLTQWVPWQPLRDLIGGEYGIITLGVRYASAIILPVVGTFFIAFSLIEDSGYLPRLAMLIDGVFKRIGLNGRAVIPLVLGFGCDTMATIVTRTLETRRERILATILLSLAIPCSAQLGVMLGLLSGRPDLLMMWAVIVTLIFLLVGFLSARLMPGERPSFYMELPPLRLPRPGNVLVKTYTRMEWYFREVFPLFIVASIVIWLGRLTGLFDVAVGALTPLVHWLGLPDQAAVAFLFGFFRRDYGAAGLYDMKGALSGLQLLVAAVTMTIFIPCVAQFSVTAKERGWKMAVAIAAFIFPFAFLVGGLLNWLLGALHLS